LTRRVCGNAEGYSERGWTLQFKATSPCIKAVLLKVDLIISSRSAIQGRSYS
jgi:hypothetical protein